MRTEQVLITMIYLKRRQIKTALKEAAKEVSINSTKSMIGHLLGAAGGVELVTCVKAMEEGYVHQTMGSRESDEGCNLNYTFGSPVHRKFAAR